MNEITKEKIAAAVIKAVEEEKLLYKEACEVFCTIPLYFTYLRNQKHWDTIPKKVWERFQVWMYSGKKLKEFKIDGQFPEYQEESEEPEEAPTKSHVIEPVIRVKPEILKERKEVEETKGRSWITNGIRETKIDRGDLVPEGWWIGRKTMKKYKSPTFTNKDYAEVAPEKPPLINLSTIQELQNITRFADFESENKTLASLLKSEHETNDKLYALIGYKDALIKYQADQINELKKKRRFGLFRRSKPIS